jgi:hypothetical protein
MQFVRSPRLAGAALVAGAITLGSSLAGTLAGASAGTLAGTAGANPRPATVATGPQMTVTGSLITPPPGTLAPGSAVRARRIFGQRVFVTASRGFALAAVGSAQYPVATTNGGKTWKTNGPALHLNAAQAPLVVTTIGATTRRTIFAYGGGGQVIDATGDGGGHWYRALFIGVPVAVAGDPAGHLVAFIDQSVGSISGGATFQYVSKDGGQTWQYDTTVGGS